MGRWVDDPVSGGSYYIPDPGETTNSTIPNTPTPSQPAPTPTPTPPAQTTQPDSGSTWKPDFGQPDPWKGMPPDYGGVGTFTPTPDNPTPPWEGSKGATDAGIPKYGTPEYNDLARDVATKELKPFETSGGQYDVTKIADAGKVEYLRALGVNESIVRQAQQYAQNRGAYNRGAKALQNYKTETGYDVARAVRDGKVNELRAIGFTDEDFKSVKEYLENKTAYDAEVAQFEKDHIFIPNDPELSNSRGVWMTQASFDALPKEAQQLILDKGIKALDSYYGKNATDASKMLPADALEVYKESGPEDKFALLKAYGVVPPDASYVKSDPQGNPTFRRGGDATEVIVGSKEFPLLVGDMLVPGFSTVRHWNEMGTGEKAFSIAMDALILIPVVGAAGKGARATSEVSRLGRFAGAAKGVGRELVAQVRAPIDVVLHPVQTVKGTVATGRDLIENIAHIRKLPEAVITTTNGTVRLPVKSVTTEAEANKIRNTIMNVAKRTGEDVVVEANGQRFTLSRSALMKETGGGLTHATPMGDVFEQGLKVAAKPNMPLSEQGLFVSHEPLPRFATSSAFGMGGTKPTVVIMSPKIAKDAISSEKIYSSAVGKVAEMESKLPVGYEIPAPSQRLFTRIGPNKTRVDILLVGFDKQLSPFQVAKLKSLAVVEDLKAPFKPSLLVEGKAPKAGKAIGAGLSESEVSRLADELRAAGNTDIADSLMRAYRGVGVAIARPRPPGDLVATGSIRERTNTGASRRESLVVTVTGTPDRPIKRVSRDDNTVVFRTSTDNTTLPGRIDIPRTNLPGPTTRNPRDVSTTGEMPRPPSTDVPRTNEPTPPRSETPEPPRTDINTPVTTDRTYIPRTGTNTPPEPRSERFERYQRQHDEQGRKKRSTKPMDDSEKRAIIASADTKVTWQQGKLHGEPVHHVVVGKDGQFEKLTVLGPAPEGAIVAEGKGQSYRTVTVAKGVQPKQPIMLEGGAIDPVVSPLSGNKRGVQIRFVPDKDVKRERKPNKMFKINRRNSTGRGVDLGADIVYDRRGRHLRL